MSFRRTMALSVAVGVLGVAATACGTGAGNTVNAGTTTTTAPTQDEGRGEVIDLSRQATIDRDEVQALLDQIALPELGPARFGMSIWRITYSTIDGNGTPIAATGSIIVPDGAHGPRPILSDQHGTQTERLAADSTPEDHESYLAGIVFAIHGYLVVAADYVGLGGSPGLHPYLHAASEASAGVDLLTATRRAATQLQTEVGDQLFLSGYSQGGHATMALHRELERYDYDLTVTASAPMAGPYDLVGSLVSALDSPAPSSALYVAYAIVGLNQIYRFVDELSGAFQAPYDLLVPQLFDGEHSAEEIAAQLPVDPNAMLTTEFLRDLRSGDSSFLDALRANNVYDWLPEAPIKLFHGKADRDVPFRNAEVAEARMFELGASVEVVNVGDDLDHETAAWPAYLGARKWFDSLATGL